jgi:D-glycero-D-manno-heptose 1,7-bisphosphate phosphatase
MNPVPKLVILGRDGILNIFREDHVKDPDEWQPIAGALEAVARLNHEGWHAVVATNQSGIGRGLLDMASVNAVHARMMQRLQAVGGRLDAVFFCPHAPEDQCECRKPLPGMMHDISERYGIELASVPMVCDTLRDLMAARAAGCQPHLVCSGRAAGLDPAQLANMLAQVPGAMAHADLSAFTDHLLRQQGSAEMRMAGPSTTPPPTSSPAAGGRA